jgi:hypothetical protein
VGGAGILLGVVVVVGIHSASRTLFPQNWLMGTLTHTAAIAAGVHVLLRFCRHVVPRLARPSTAPPPDSPDQ